MAYLETSGAQIHFEGDDAGDRPWVTLINGYTKTMRDFRLFRKKLVSEGYKVLLLDNRESGLSTSAEAFDVYDFAEDITALWSELKIQSSYVLGISMGGLIAQRVAMDHPEKVKGCFFISTFADRKWMKQSDMVWSEDVQSNKEFLQTYVSPKFLEGNSLLIDLMAKQMTKEIQSGDFLERARRQREAFSNYYVSDSELQAISCPCLVVHGQEDQIVDIQAAEHLCHHLPQSHLEIFPESGHLLLAENSSELYNLVSRYLGEWS